MEYSAYYEKIWTNQVFVDDRAADATMVGRETDVHVPYFEECCCQQSPHALLLENHRSDYWSSLLLLFESSQVHSFRRGWSDPKYNVKDTDER